ncbi:MAG: TIGR04255 family protein [Alphaproteobacteria bacterium]|nr:TIGR04255 family protein [Alphaproteobacteria bacterium]
MPILKKRTLLVNQMTTFQYKRAPIIEAVVEFRSDDPVDNKKRAKALKKLNRFYTNHQPISQHDLEVKISDGQPPTTQSVEVIIDRLSSADMTEQLHIRDIAFLSSQLAPYHGWEAFRERITRDWNIWRGTVGFRPITRIGMRYINRIDLPALGDEVRYEDYVSIYPNLPPLLDPCLSHTVSVNVAIPDIDAILTLKTAIVESPLPNHLSIMVDLDIKKTFQTPPSDEEIFSFIDQARIKKNEAFESCIKDKARDIFKL